MQEVLPFVTHFPCLLRLKVRNYKYLDAKFIYDFIRVSCCNRTARYEVPGNLPILEVTELRNNTSVFCQGSNMSAIFAGFSG